MDHLVHLTVCLLRKWAKKAVDLLMQGIGGQCIAIRNNKIVAIPITEALGMPHESRKPLMNLFERLV